jgi:predicted porin
MNKKLNLAVASAVLAMGASAAQAGIIIPAGDWTIDINGNVNAYYIYNNSSDSNTIEGGLANTQGSNGDNSSAINTGLLPSWLGVSGKTRANDLDVGFTISFQPGASTTSSLQGGGSTENRQAFLTFGDKSWGSIKIGKDLGVFGSDAILNDMTLLGVGSQGLVGTSGGTTTTLGRIGTGYMYADWHGQIAYSSPNWNGFDFTVAIENPWNTLNLSSSSAASTGNQEMPAFSGKLGYAWGGDFSGKVWAEGWTQQVDGIDNGIGGTDSEDARVFGIGAKVGFGDFDLVGYYYDGTGVGTTDLLMDGFYADSNGNVKKRDSDGGYIQGTYKLGNTKLGLSWGESNLDEAGGENSDNLVKKNEMWTAGVYHALTKNLNLVAEYSQVTAENQAGDENDSDIISAGAILFF